MIKNLTNHGNSYALMIDEPILELLRVSPETPFEIVTDGQCLVLAPVRDPAGWRCSDACADPNPVPPRL